MNSFGFCSSGSKVEKGTSTPYGAKFKVGDIIGCWISKDSTNVIIKFTINGEDQGIAWVNGVDMDYYQFRKAYDSFDIL